MIECFEEIQRATPELKIHLILVNDGSAQTFSKKGFDSILSKIPDAQLVSYTKNRGKGFALRKGLEVAKNNICVYTDIDFPYENKDTVKVFKKLIEHSADVVHGIRNKSYVANAPKFRAFISKLLKRMIKTTLRLKVHDTQCGLKGFNQKGKEIFLQTSIDRYLFDLEFIFLASKKKGISIQPEVVTLKEDVVFSTMSFKTLTQEALNFFKLILKSLFH